MRVPRTPQRKAFESHYGNEPSPPPSGVRLVTGDGVEFEFRGQAFIGLRIDGVPVKAEAATLTIRRGFVGAQLAIEWPELRTQRGRIVLEEDEAVWNAWRKHSRSIRSQTLTIPKARETRQRKREIPAPLHGQPFFPVAPSVVKKRRARRKRAK